MIDRLYYFLVWLIDKFGRPRETHGQETEDVLKLKKQYEEAAKDAKNSNDTHRG